MKVLRRMNEEFNRRLEEVTIQVQVLMAERKTVEELLGKVIGLQHDLHHPQQDFTLMKDSATSELAVLEGTVPNIKEIKQMERSTIEVNRVLQQLKEDVKGNGRGLKFLSDQ
eukprot:12905375-Prorocentrum_lima.AAC.1